jgi:tRNA(Ile)-lysidine synthase
MHVSREYLLTYFEDFLSQANLFNKENIGAGKRYVACSGGADSMLMLWLLNQLGVEGLCALHVNYKSSEFSDRAQRLVQEFCAKNAIAFKHYTSDVYIEDSNFEKRARNDRYSWFHSLLNLEDLLFTGHNLTDSMEWSWMQMLKSSHPRNWLGIPLKNGRIRRPLMCLARHQVRNLVDHFKIPFLDDPSNNSTEYERNRMRHKHLKELKADYPALEKNYVARHNQLAVQWGKHFSQRPTQKNYQRTNLRLGGVLLEMKSDSLLAYKEKIVQQIHAHSNSTRGSLRNQFEKLDQAWRSKKEGPLLFSGGVRIFLFQGAILILSQSQFESYQQWDLDFAFLLRNTESKTLLNKINSDKTSYKFPSDFLCQFEEGLKNKDFAPRKKPFPLLPRTCEALNSLGIPWQTSFRHHLISQKRRKLVK